MILYDSMLMILSFCWMENVALEGWNNGRVEDWVIGTIDEWVIKNKFEIRIPKF